MLKMGLESFLKHRFLGSEIESFGLGCVHWELSCIPCSSGWMASGAGLFPLSFGWLNSMKLRSCATSSLGTFYQGLRVESTTVLHLLIEKLPCKGLRLMGKCSVVTMRKEDPFI